MKKLFIIFVLFLLTGGVFAQELALDEAIERAARDIEVEMPQRALLLMLNISSPSEDFSHYVMDELTDHLVIGRKVSVVDRQNLNAIRAETNFQYSGEVSDDSMVSIGKMLGANYIVTGSLNQRGANYRLRFRVIGVETARIITSVILDIKNDAQVARLIGGERAAQEIERKQQEEERARPTSNVRDNWISAEISVGAYQIYTDFTGGISVGARYERMINSKFSLGANFYGFVIPFSFENTDSTIAFGIDAFVRLYPIGRKFFLGLAVGYFDLGNSITGTETDYLGNYHTVYYKDTGIEASLEFGWKIDVGNEGGFFIQPSIISTFLFGKNKEFDFGGYYRFVLGAGWAF